MKFVKFALILGIINLSEGSLFISVKSATPDEAPYLAYVKSEIHCLGALISHSYVVVIAYCLEGQLQATVYLGAKTMPYHDLFDWGNWKTLQKIDSKFCLIYPGSQNSEDKIGLIKLKEDITITAEVRPATLPNPWDFPVPEETLLTVTGYMNKLLRNDKLRYMVVRVRPQRRCSDLYVMFKSDLEQCVKGDGMRIDMPGPFVIYGVLVGIGRLVEKRKECKPYLSDCNTRDVFVSLGPYLEWIYEKVGLPLPTKTKATTTTPTTRMPTTMEKIPD